MLSLLFTKQKTKKIKNLLSDVMMQYQTPQLSTLQLLATSNHYNTSMRQQQLYSHPCAGVVRWLGTTFFYVLNASFFCVLLHSFKERNVLLHSFFEFLATYETPKDRCVLLRSFLESKRMQRTQLSFAKNVKERNVLLQRT